MNTSSDSSNSERLRVAVTNGSTQLPWMDYIISHAEMMSSSTDSRLFTYALEGAAPLTIPTVQAFGRLSVPSSVRRRAFPVTDIALSRAIVRWGPDIVHQHFLSAGDFGGQAAKSLGCPLVTTVHAQEHSLVRKATDIRARYLRRRCERVLDRTDVFIAVSNYVATWLGELGIEAARIRTQYIGVDTTYWRSNSDPAARQKAQRITFVGHLSRGKGIEDLIAASKAIEVDTPHSVVLVGDDGGLLEMVKSFASSRPNIRVAGKLDRDRVREVLEGSTLLVLPAKENDGIREAAGLVLLEAQSMGVPAVAYASGGTPEMLEGSPQCLVAEGDVDELAATMRRILRMELDDYTELCNEVRAWTAAERSAHKQAAATRATFDSLASAGRGNPGK